MVVVGVSCGSVVGVSSGAVVVGSSCGAVVSGSSGGTVVSEPAVLPGGSVGVAEDSPPPPEQPASRAQDVKRLTAKIHKLRFFMLDRSFTPLFDLY